MRTSLSCLALLVGIVGFCPLATAEIIYQNDFEGAVGAEWSNTMTSVTHDGRVYLGGFASELVSLSLSGVAPGEVTVSFDLYVIGSWDGRGFYGLDIFDLNVTSGPALLHTTFSNNAYRQDYPDNYPGESHPGRTGASEVISLSSALRDSVYSLSFSFENVF